MAGATPSATAQTALGGVASGDAMANGDFGTATGTAITTDGIVNGVTATASTLVTGMVSADAGAAGGTPSFGDITTDFTEAYASAGALATLTGLASNVDAAFDTAGAVSFGTGSMGAGVADTASGTQSFTDTMDWTVSTASLNSGQLDLGLVYTTYAGKSPSVDSLTFQVFVDGSRIVNQTLAGPTAANTYFTNNLIDLGAVPMAGQVNGSVDVTLSLAETMSTPDGFGINFMLGDVSCFAAGTRIGTERGEVLVEELHLGDRVLIVGDGSSEPVVWIGHRTADCARHPKPQQVWPVRIAAHALGPGRPSRDLWLSPDHAVFVNNVLIPVKHLINGRTISQVPCDEVTYYHVELPQHSVLLAEGLPVES